MGISCNLSFSLNIKPLLGRARDTVEGTHHFNLDVVGSSHVTDENKMCIHLQNIRCDLCGANPVTFVQGFGSYLIFVDDCLNTWVYASRGC